MILDYAIILHPSQNELSSLITYTIYRTYAYHIFHEYFQNIKKNKIR